LHVRSLLSAFESKIHLSPAGVPLILHRPYQPPADAITYTSTV
jgi:hypothetical protein